MKNVMIKAIIETVRTDPTQYKMYNVTLTFDGGVLVEIPVPETEVRKEGNKLILTLEGFKILLNTYTQTLEKLHNQYLKSFQ